MSSCVRQSGKGKPRVRDSGQPTEACGVKMAGSLTSETAVIPPLRTNAPRRTGDRYRPARGL